MEQYIVYGISKVFNPQMKTTIGARAVTPGFSPHEQYGQGITDVRSDIYALGATLYTLLTGLVPEESISRVVNDPLIPPQMINPVISTNIAAAIEKAMQIFPDNRFTSVDELKSFLDSPDQQNSTLVIEEQGSSSKRLSESTISVEERKFVHPKKSKYKQRWIILGINISSPKLAESGEDIILWNFSDRERDGSASTYILPIGGDTPKKISYPSIVSFYKQDHFPWIVCGTPVDFNGDWDHQNGTCWGR